MSKYLNRVSTATTLDELDAIVMEASFDDYITHKEYEQVYESALSLAQSWNVI